MVEFIEKIFKGRSKSPEMILSEMIEPQNIELKTEISQPINLAKLSTIAEACRHEKLERTARVIDYFVEKYLRYEVSHNRESRREMIEGLKAIERANEPSNLPPI